MKFESTFKNNNKNIIEIGYYDNKEVFQLDIEKNPSIVITGETGSGKSILLDQCLVQLIKKHTSLEMGIIAVDTSGVELNYYENSKYALFSAINDEEKGIIALTRILREIDRRQDLFKQENVLNVNEYNSKSDSKLPLLVVAIDDDKNFLRLPDVDKMLSGIITQLHGIGIILILATNDVNNKFFESDKNTFASVMISFDFAEEESSLKANIEDAEDLSIGKFYLQEGDNKHLLNSFGFDDHIIGMVLNG